MVAAQLPLLEAVQLLGIDRTGDVAKVAAVLLLFTHPERRDASQLVASRAKPRRSSHQVHRYANRHGHLGMQIRGDEFKGEWHWRVSKFEWQAYYVTTPQGRVTDRFWEGRRALPTRQGVGTTIAGSRLLRPNEYFMYLYC